MATAERQYIADFTAKYGASGVERVEAEDITPAKLPDLLQGATLFATNRLVVIKNIASAKQIHDALVSALANVADSITVIIVEPALDKRTKLYKVLKADSQFKEFSLLSDAQLIDWVIAEAEKLGGKLSRSVAQHLLRRAGRDQWRLANELQKITSYQAAPTEQTIDSLVEATPEGSAFELLDAALAGKAAVVDELIMTLKTQEDPYKLFGLLASQVHTLAVVAVAGTRSPDVIAKDAGLHPFVVRKTQTTARRLGEARVASIAADVALCDAQLKSTSADPWLLLRLCLQKIAAK